MTTKTTCTTCTRPVESPYRRLVAGVIVAGCVSACHDGHVYGESARWHNRKGAVRIRKTWKKFLTAHAA